MTNRAYQRRGRPLVFLASVCLGWVALRVSLLAVWPDQPAAPLADPAPAEAQQVSNGQTIARADASPVTPVGEDDSESRATPALDEAEAKGPVAQGVIGLDAAPPAHLQDGLETPTMAVAHSSLWIAASVTFDAPPIATEAASAGAYGGQSDTEADQ